MSIAVYTEIVEYFIHNIICSFEQKYKEKLFPLIFIRKYKLTMGTKETLISDKTCPGDGNCNGNGQCNNATGICECQQPYFGETCQCNVQIVNL